MSKKILSNLIPSYFSTAHLDKRELVTTLLLNITCSKRRNFLSLEYTAVKGVYFKQTHLTQGKIKERVRTAFHSWGFGASFVESFDKLARRVGSDRIWLTDLLQSTPVDDAAFRRATFSSGM